MAYGDFKDLNRKIAADKVLRDKAFNIANDPKYGRYQRGFASLDYIFLEKNTTGSGINCEDIISSRITHTNYYNIWEKKSTLTVYRQWGADLADMQFIGKI